MKIRQVEVEVFHVEGRTQTGSHDKADSSSSRFCERD